MVSVNETNMYDVNRCVAEFYDLHETYTDDVELVRRLIGERGPLRVLEPFCGTGRILIPLAQDGHELTSMDQGVAMLERCRAKVERLPSDVQQRIALLEADVTAAAWPRGFDLVVLGGNCFYELATADEQEGCIASAVASLKPGGWVYVDNNHMEGDLAEAWQQPGVSEAFPTGTLPDGTRLAGTGGLVWCDPKARLIRSRRTVTVTRPDGTSTTKAWIQQKHPPSTPEMRGWLAAHGFAVEQLFGDRHGSPYTETSGRAIFWARRSRV